MNECVRVGGVGVEQEVNLARSSGQQPLLNVTVLLMTL